MSKDNDVEVGGLGNPLHDKGISLADAARAVVRFEKEHQIRVSVTSYNSSKLEI